MQHVNPRNDTSGYSSSLAGKGRAVLRRVTGLASLGIVLGTVSAQGAVLSYRTVAFSNSAIPDYTGNTGTASGTVFGNGASNAFSNLALNDSGNVAFQATLTGGTVSGTTNNAGVWSEGSGTLKMVERKLDPTPDYSGNAISGVTYTTPNIGPNLTSTGKTGWKASLQGTGVSGTGVANNAALFSDASGTIQMKVRQADTGPGTSGQFIQGLGGPPVMNPSGTIAFVAPLGTAFTSSNTSEWTVDSSGVLTKIIAAGDSAPGTDIGSGTATFGTSTAGTPVLNANGAVAFTASLTTGSNGVVSGTNSTGIWSTASTGLHLVARPGDVANGTGGGTFASSLSAGSVDMNNAGTVVFSDTLNAATGSVTTTNNAGVWKGASESSLALVAQKGSAVPSLSGVTYSAFAIPLINSAGNASFESTLAGTGVIASVNDTALLSENSGVISLIARSGTLAPGGLFFRSFSSGTSYQFNALGNMAFIDTLSTAAGGATAQTGLFAQDSTGALNLVAETGQTFQVAPGDIRTISGLSYGSISSISSGGEDGRVMAYNNNNTIDFTLLFTDGSSGVFTASVPEPTSLSLLAVGSGLLMRRSRRNRLQA